MTKTENQVLALAGIFQACFLVDKIAQTGSCDEEAFKHALETLFVTTPKDTLDVFKNVNNLRDGLLSLEHALNSGKHANFAYIIRYALAIMHLQTKLSKQPEMLETISKRIERAQEQQLHFGIDHDNVIANLADTYQDTLSTFSLRIQVSGHAKHLQVERNACKIRALLLASARSSILWRQLGGHRWQLLFCKSRLLTATQTLLKQTQTA